MNAVGVCNRYKYSTFPWLLQVLHKQIFKLVKTKHK